MNNVCITPEDARNILLLINRTQLQGNEAEGVVMIKQKLVEIAKPLLEKEVKAKKNDN